MILSDAAYKLLTRLFTLGHPIQAHEREAAAVLTALGLAQADPFAPRHAHSLKVTSVGFGLVGRLVRCDDAERLPGAATSWGRCAGMVIPNDGARVKLSFVQGEQLLSIDLPSDCWILVLP